MKRVRYISRFSHPMDRASIDELVVQAQTHNEQKGITGILVATGDVFFQIIEGPDHEVEALYARICKDPRHKELMMLSVEQGDLDPLCPDWAMRKVDLSRESVERLEPIRMLLKTAHTQRRLADEAVATLEAFTWRGFIDAELEALTEDL
jgi:adenylate cyclase